MPFPHDVALALIENLFQFAEDAPRNKSVAKVPKFRQFFMTNRSTLSAIIPHWEGQ